MKYRGSLMKYAQTHGVSRASRRYNKSRLYIYFWLKRYDGTLASFVCQVSSEGRRYYQYTAIDEYSRLRSLEAFEEANTYSSQIFAQHVLHWFGQRGIKVECI